MEVKDILGIVIVLVVMYLFITAVSKWITEIKWKRQLNTKPTYKTIEDRIRDLEELHRLSQIEFNRFYQKLFVGKTFVNKDASSLAEFTITEEMNVYDLHKLAQLNGIKVEMAKGWTALALALMVELDKTGWNKKVTSIKEKFGELRFYADTDREDILEKYTAQSLHTCEICGQQGRHFVDENGWHYTRCSIHS